MEEKNSEKKKEKCAIPVFRGLEKCQRGGSSQKLSIIAR